PPAPPRRPYPPLFRPASGSDVGLQRHWSARVRPEPVPGPERGRPAEQPGGRPADRYYLQRSRGPERPERAPADGAAGPGHGHVRSEEHTSELQSRETL